MIAIYYRWITYTRDFYSTTSVKPSDNLSHVSEETILYHYVLFSGKSRTIGQLNRMLLIPVTDEEKKRIGLWIFIYLLETC